MISGNNLQVHFTGPSIFQNKLLSRVIELEMGIPCYCSEDLPSASPGVEDCPATQLILFDYQMHLSRLRDWQISQDHDRSFQIIALFNACPDETQKLCICFMRKMQIRGVFMENTPAENMIKGIQAILRNELWFPRATLNRFIMDPHHSGISFGKKSPCFFSELFSETKQPEILTKREKEILLLLSSGGSNEQIAERLCISTHTVKTHAQNIFSKIGVSGRFQAALWAAENL